MYLLFQFIYTQLPKLHLNGKLWIGSCCVEKAWAGSLCATAPLQAHWKDCIHLFYCIRALCKYVHCRSLRERAPSGLDSAFKEGNLRASNECPLTYVSLTHSRTHTRGHQHHHARWGSRPICARGTPGHPTLSSITAGCSVSTQGCVNSLLIMRPHSAQAHIQGCCLVACPQPVRITKGRVGSLGLRTPEGSASLITQLLWITAYS